MSACIVKLQDAVWEKKYSIVWDLAKYVEEEDSLPIFHIQQNQKIIFPLVLRKSLQTIEVILPQTEKMIT